MLSSLVNILVFTSHAGIEGPGMPVRHSAASDNKNVTTDIPREKLEECFPHKLKHSNGAKDWLIPNNTFKISNSARPLMTRDYSCNHMKQTSFI